MCGYELIDKCETKIYMCEELEVANDLIQFHQSIGRMKVLSYEIKRLENPKDKYKVVLKLVVKFN